MGGQVCDHPGEMRVSVQLPTDQAQAPEEFLSAAAIAEMAQTAENAGFDACFVTDHPIPDERWLRAGGHHTMDPFVALSFAGAATQRIRLQTHILVLPYRNPFLVAKAAASLDVASGGRLILGVGAGYQKGEFAALGVDPAERNELVDEALQVLNRTWKESNVQFEGRHFRARGNTALPQPKQQPHPPIWVGGNSRRAIRRAVEWGEGWLPFPAPAALAGTTRTAPLDSLEELRQRIDYAREHAQKIGRERPLDICFVPFGLESFGRGEFEKESFLAGVREMEALGVTWLAIVLRAPSRAEYCSELRAFGDQILSHL